MIARWLDRRPLLVSTLASAAILGLIQAAAALIWNRAFLGPEAAIGIAKVSYFIALLTVVLLLPIVLLLRRRSSSWRAGETLAATWSASFGLVVGLGTWIVADIGASGSWIPRAAAPWIAGAIALAAGVAASTLRASARWLRGAALVSAALLLFCFYPYPPQAPP